MLDTMTMTKVVGAFCGALLVYLLGSWVGEALYHTGSHGEHEQAYVIDTGESEDGGGDVAEEVPFLTMVRDGDPDAGARVFRQCQACHKIDAAQNGAGPHLVNILGRQIASAEGFNYSGALPEGEWGVDNLNHWLENPSGFAPGTSMSYAGVKNAGDRANLVAYMASMTEGYTLPEGQAAAPADDSASQMAEAQVPAEDAAPAAGETADAFAAEPAEAVSAEAPASDSAEGEAAASAEAETSAPEAVESAETEAPAEEATETAEANSAAPEASDSAEAAAEPQAAGGEVSAIQAAYDNADIAEGKKVFRQCQACHVADKEQNRVGPHLVGILGRAHHAVEGFRYSGALPDGVWTLEDLNAWLENPKAFAPGTSMAFRGLSDIQDRANVIAYIESLN